MGTFRLGPGAQVLYRLIGPLTFGFDFALGFNLEGEDSTVGSDINNGIGSVIGSGGGAATAYIKELYFFAPTIGVLLPTNPSNTAYLDVSIQPGIVIGSANGAVEAHPAIGLRVQDHRMLSLHPTVSLTYGSDIIVFENNFGATRGWDVQAFINVGLSGIF